MTRFSKLPYFRREFKNSNIASGRKPPTFLVQPQAVTVKAGDQVMFTAKVCYRA